jgi:hypothetical protein
VLPHHHPVIFQIAHVDAFAFVDHIWMLANHYPAHVGEEEASVDVVRVGICVRELVVDPVVSCPHVHARLVAEGVAKDQEEAQGKSCFVSAVAPEAVGAADGTDIRKFSQQKS